MKMEWENEQANESGRSVHNTATTGQLDLRSPATVNTQTDTSYISTNQGNYGGEA